MKKYKSVEEYISDYLKSVPLKGYKSYSQWISETGADRGANRAVQFKNAHAKYLSKGSMRGASGEALHGKGLTRSGYADYIKKAAADSYRADTNEVRRGILKDGQQNIAGYKSYISEYVKKAETVYYNAIDAISRAGIVDFDTAYAQAINYGVDKENAKKLAATVVKNNVEAVKKDLMKIILEERFTDSQAKEYALTVGLPEDVAEELAKYAYSINQNIADQGALDDFRDKYNSKK